ncbi:MAG: DUF349 domain-containing protein [Paludibacteraceae bacterium]|nr:DUF349 domain-containing protein [Paludibacteraceae bacterium]
MEKDKQALIEELRSLLEQDVSEIKDQVENLKNQFYRQYHEEQAALKKAAEELAAAAGEELKEWQPKMDELENQFRELLNEYKAKRAEVAKQVEAELQQNLLRKENILSQMKEMAQAQTADVMDNLKKMRELQAEWKTIGAVPPTKTQEIWKQYNLYQEQFYDLVKINIELRDLDFKKNLEMKTLLIEAAQKLQENPNIVEASRALQQLHDEWAEIGPVARELRDELWNQFKEASSIINKKHQAYFDALHEKENENLRNKQAIIEQLKAINFAEFKSNKQWEKATQAIQQLQDEWRKIGFAPKKQNQSIYEEFRGIVEAFFKAKTAYYKSMREELGENLKKKRSLIERAEALKASDAWQETSEALIELQKEWKTIGPVARKYSDDLWKKFTDTCDEFFNAKREANKVSRDAYQQKKAEAKERWSKRVEEIGDRGKLIKMYENLQQEIKTAENNILFFTGKSKSANQLVNDMQKKIGGLKAQLNELEQKINALDAE